VLVIVSVSFFGGGILFFHTRSEKAKNFFFETTRLKRRRLEPCKNSFSFFKNWKKKQQNSLRCWNIFIRRPRKGKFFLFLTTDGNVRFEKNFDSFCGRALLSIQLHDDNLLFYG
jgi:hypothetical protein